LLNTALPHWLQMLGMFFSLMLWAPSWGGMLNGLLTLRGAWDKLRTDPVVKFFVAGVTFYGMATFEGPLLSIRAVNALSHYSDWTIGHVHSGALGWNGFMAAGMFYWLAPRLWGTKLHSESAANFHFWIGTIGILLYVVAMWISGVMQGLMLNATTPDGTALQYPNFLETLQAIRPLMALRIVGGAMYLVGFILMCWNIGMTIKSGKPVNETREVTPLIRDNSTDSMTMKDTIFNDPVFYCLGAIFLISGWLFLPAGANVVALVCSLIFCAMAVKRFMASSKSWSEWYERLLHNYLPFTILTFVAVVVGGLIQLVPTVTVNRAKNIEDHLQKPYTPLEVAGRDIYVSEGCYNCHSQMIRTMVPDVLRYGDYSRLGESIYDHPFQWGSKRTGPDLAREGFGPNHKSDSWHYKHLMDPRSMSSGSNMPPYSHLAETPFDQKTLPKKIAVLTQLGVPYPVMEATEIKMKALEQGAALAKSLASEGIVVQPDKQIVAVIAYLQKLGAYEMPEIAPKLTAPKPPIPLPVNPDKIRTTSN
jgi:cytochrome c oxidase cbb3-type subunit I/II